MNRIRKYRVSAGMSQQELAEQTGMTRNAISYMERTGCKVRSSTAALMSKALKVPADVLTGESNEYVRWQDAEVYNPEVEAPYNVAYRRKRSSKYNYAVLLWKDKAWWLPDWDGRPVEAIAPNTVLWWAEIEEPPV